MQTILIVDDSPTIRRMLRVSLTTLSDISVTEASTGLEAIERLTLARVALMVLDLNMPDMHGLEVLSFVRRHPTYQSMPVIVLTTRGDEESRAAATAAGATLYLTKPFQPQALAGHVRALLDSNAAAASENHSRVR